MRSSSATKTSHEWRDERPLTKLPSATVRVPLENRAYDIEIAAGALETAAGRVLQVIEPSRVVVITDSTVGDLYGDPIREGFIQAGHDAVLLRVPAGEASKSVDQAQQLWQQVLASGADRKSVIVALGGGVVGDLAGFVAASFARGIAFVQLPTTLLAQVDSSVGGKVGINLPAAKNMVGAFWQPRLVLIDTLALKTLSDREYRAGLAEVVKYGVILDADFFAMLESHVQAILARDPIVLRDLVARCCQLKTDIVVEDEFETSGRRAVLNYGHTFGHALEAITGYGQLLHGEAVAIGMLCASRLANLLDMIPAGLTERQENLLQSLGLPTKLPDVDDDELVTAMQHDKKTEQGRLHFILPTELGQVILVADVRPSDVISALRG